MDQAAPPHQSVLRHQRECGEDSNLDRGVGVRARGDRSTSLYQILQILSVTIFEKVPILQAFEALDSQSEFFDSSNQMILFDF